MKYVFKSEDDLQLDQVLAIRHVLFYTTHNTNTKTSAIHAYAFNPFNGGQETRARLEINSERIVLMEQCGENERLQSF